MYLRDSLQNWEVDDSLPIGFEILLPALLSMLESENIHFVFPGRHKLENLNARKMTRFDLEVLYRTPTTFLHSLEAFIGRLDFDKLTSHKTCGSMMASPSSTAAYLMHTSVWDSEAELYLRKALREGSGNGNGGVPGVFPIPVFEVSWVSRSMCGPKKLLYNPSDSRLSFCPLSFKPGIPVKRWEKRTSIRLLSIFRTISNVSTVFWVLVGLYRGLYALC